MSPDLNSSFKLCLYLFWAVKQNQLINRIQPLLWTFMQIVNNCGLLSKLRIKMFQTSWYLIFLLSKFEMQMYLFKTEPNIENCKSLLARNNKLYQENLGKLHRIKERFQKRKWSYLLFSVEGCYSHKSVFEKWASLYRVPSRPYQYFLKVFLFHKDSLIWMEERWSSDDPSPHVGW